MCCVSGIPPGACMQCLRSPPLVEAAPGVAVVLGYLPELLAFNLSHHVHSALSLPPPSAGHSATPPPTLPLLMVSLAGGHLASIYPLVSEQIESLSLTNKGRVRRADLLLVTAGQGQWAGRRQWPLPLMATQPGDLLRYGPYAFGQ